MIPDSPGMFGVILSASSGDGKITEYMTYAATFTSGVEAELKACYLLKENPKIWSPSRSEMVICDKATIYKVVSQSVTHISFDHEMPAMEATHG